MANTLRIKRRASGGSGAPSSLENAELAYNEVDDILYYGKGTGGSGGTATTVIPIGGPGQFVQLTTDQTIAGVKTFSTSPVVPTQITGDNSTKVASTAFVKAQNYLTGNQTITYTGDVTGTGTTSVILTLANSGVGAGTYRSVTVDVKGRVTAGTNPTTLVGYGITDAQGLNASLTSIGGLPGTTGLLRKTAAHTYTLDTATYLTGNQTITVSGDATGTGTTAISLTLANSGATAGTYRSVTVDVKGRVTGGTNPTTIAGYGITDAYTKTEVDSAISSAAMGLDPKESVRAIATSPITLFAAQTIDGVSCIVGDRVLVAGQGSAYENGIYVVSAGSWLRSPDANVNAKVTTGMYTFVSEGTLNANTGWYLTTDDPINLGSTGLNFIKFTGAGSILAGTGIVKAGDTLSVSTELQGYHNNATSGMIARTAAGTVIGRTLSISGSGVSVSNGNGVAGNPTISLSTLLSNIAAATFAADTMVYMTGATTVASTAATAFGRSLIGTESSSTGRTLLGLGTISTQNSNSVNITGGSITNLTTFDGITIDCGAY